MAARLHVTEAVASSSTSISGSMSSDRAIATLLLAARQAHARSPTSCPTLVQPVYELESLRDFGGFSLSLGRRVGFPNAMSPQTVEKRNVSCIIYPIRLRRVSVSMSFTSITVDADRSCGNSRASQRLTIEVYRCGRAHDGKRTAGRYIELMSWSTVSSP